MPVAYICGRAADVYIATTDFLALATGGASVPAVLLWSAGRSEASGLDELYGAADLAAAVDVMVDVSAPW
jgi:hypothetical protein